MAGASQFLNYDLGVLSRLYAQEPGVSIGFPYVNLHRWQISDETAAKEPFRVSVSRDRFAIRSDRPPDWRRVSSRAFEALGEAGHDLSWSESKIRVRAFDAKTRTLSVQLAEYDDQRRSNMILDYHVSGAQTLRDMLRSEYGPRLPALGDDRLANTLGVALMVLVKEFGRLYGYCVRRPETGIAVFQNTWTCTASGAAKWPLKDDEESFYAELTEDILEELSEEVGLKLQDLTFFMPIALSRELVRGGKPELFFLAGSNLSRAVLKERRSEARRNALALHQPLEVEADSFLGSAAQFIDVQAELATIMAKDMSHQASALLLEARNQYDDILAHHQWAS